MKKLFSLVLIMLFVLMSVTVLGVGSDSDVNIDIDDQYTTRFIVDKVTAGDDDETVNVNIRVGVNSGFAGMSYTLFYDSDVLVLEEEPVCDMQSLMFTSGPIGEGSHTGMLWSQQNVYDTGVLLTYTFRVNPEAKSGLYKIAFTPSDVLDDRRRPVKTIFTAGGVTIPYYTVTFDANGGNRGPQYQNKTKNEPMYFVASYPVREGYRFLGWATSADATVAEYQPGDIYYENADLELFAVWEKHVNIAGSIDVEASVTQAKSGDEAEIVISIDNHDGFAGMDFDVIYDNTKLDYISYERNMDLNVLVEASSPDKYENKVNFQILAMDNVAKTGDLVTLKFKVLESKEDVYSNISVVFADAFVYSGANNDEATLLPNVRNGCVVIFNSLEGDINLDGVVNSDDAVILYEYFGDGDNIEYLGSLDFNGDGEEDEKDAVALLRLAMFKNPLIAETPETAKAVYTVSSTMGYTGEDIEVAISLETRTTFFTAFGIENITYDKNALTLNSFTIEDDLGKNMLIKDVSEMTAVSAHERGVSSYNGAVLKLSFTIKQDAVPGNYEITGVPAVMAIDLVESYIVPGVIEIKDISDKPVVPVSSVVLDKTSALLKVGEGITLSVTVGPENATDKTVTWESSDTSVATVEDGIVKTFAKGTAKITARSNNGKTATCTVTVGVPADKVVFTPPKFTSIAIEQNMALKATAVCSDGTKPYSASVEYEVVEGKDKAIINSAGRLTGVAYGDVVVRATAVFGTETAYADVAVRICIPATKVSLNKTSAAMALGEGELQLEAVMSPSANTDVITWSVDKPEIATVDENGLVTAHAFGKAKITAKSGSGKSATCTVTVGNAADAVEVSTLKSTSLAVGKYISLKAKAYRTDGEKPVSTNVVYEIVDGKDFATVDAKGKLVGVKVGDVTVRVRAEAGTEEAYKDIVITVCIPATKITLDKTKASIALGEGDLQLYAIVTPSDNTDKITWISANEEIATVDENGLVTAHSTGKVKITAKAESGKSASCTVTVGLAADAVEYSSLKATSLAVGKYITLKAKAYREDGEKPVSANVVYEIVDGEEFATIDSVKGKLTAIAEGEVTVRARAEAGTEDAYEDVVIRVCVPATKVTLNKTKASMALGYGDLQLEAVMSVSGDDECTDTLTWSVDKPEIATVDENGLVTAHAFGKAKITAKSGSGKTASCSITVGFAADTVEFSSLKATSLAVGKYITLKAKAYREDGEKPVSTNVVYEIVDGEEFATIDPVKGKLTAIAEGEVTVRARAEAGTEDAYEDVVIRVCVPATKVTLSATKATLSLDEEVFLLEAIMSPVDECTDTLTWESSDEDIATVDENGFVTLHSKGKVKITAKTGSGKSAYCTVTVTAE